MLCAAKCRRIPSKRSQVPRLQALQRQAAANGVTDMVWLSGREATSKEPQLSAVAALLSPSTGILDSHTYMTSLAADAQVWLSTPWSHDAW
jgi:L-2-hydroxyglutarate oxidase LhgO